LSPPRVITKPQDSWVKLDEFKVSNRRARAQRYG
jgi:hypothetical protein